MLPRARGFRWILAFAIAAYASAWTSTATAAHPLVEEGRARFEQADFNGALQALQQAQDQGGLGRDDLVLLLETRALVHRALGHDEQTRTALRALASVDPDHRFAPEVSPDLVQRFAQLRDEGPGPLELEVSHEIGGSSVTLAAEVRGDVTDMVHTVSVSARVDDQPWRRSDDGRLKIDTSPGAQIAWYAVAYGPGGAPVARRGSDQAPRTFAVPRGDDATTTGASSQADDDGSSAGLWIGVGAGVVAVATAVTLGILLSGGGQKNTRVEGPILPEP